MHRLVHPTFHSRLLSALRRPSFAGTGLPERMRSLSFALLGLTTAAGLALVAIFAQPGFPVLSPAPLPDEPSASQSIAGAKKLATGTAVVALTAALPAPPKREETGSTVAASPQSAAVATSGRGSDKVQVAAAEIDGPTPVSAPQSSGGSSAGGEAESGGGGSSGPASTAAPEQPVAAPSSPASSPQPSKPKPEAIASAPKPEPAPAPGNSSSASAAEHASERGIEASASPGPPPSTASAAPEASSSPGNGNGLAKGHFK